MKISIRHIERTCLSLEPYIEFVKKYTKDIQNDVLIVFDLRVKELYGFHIYEYEKKLHTIRISPVKHQTLDEKNDTIILDDGSELVGLISTTLHELNHARQRETMKNSFFKKSFCENSHCVNKELKEKYSQCELECQIYERENLLEATEFYKKACK